MISARPAGFWIRAAAALIDFAVFALVQLSFRLIGAKIVGPDAESVASFRPLATFFTFVFAGAYTTVLHALGGQTIGKMIVGIHVVAGDGGVPRVGTALLRHLGYFASGAVVTVGFLMAGLRADKRALHDLIAGTRVERLPRPDAGEPAPPPPQVEAPADFAAP
jgi:uncharacterized RDD family membrane protein YckC